MGYAKRKTKILHTYGSGPGAYITDELKRSTAYRSLTPVQRLILLDMVRCYLRVSLNDTQPISETGFTYTWSQCIECVDEKTLRDTRKVLCKKGLFRFDRRVQEGKPGAPFRYLPSAEWRKYEPTYGESARLRMRDKRKREILQRDRERRTQHRAEMGCQRVKRVGSDPLDKTGRNSLDKNGGDGKNSLDTETENRPVRRVKSPGSIVTRYSDSADICTKAPCNDPFPAPIKLPVFNVNMDWAKFLVLLTPNETARPTHGTPLTQQERS